jgi:hypothetical protein
MIRKYATRERTLTSGLAAASLLAATVLCACSETQVREERYLDGARKSRAVFMRKPDDALRRHGVQMTWYPSGERESMETYVDGYQQGYAIRWYPGGAMKSVEHYTDGMKDGKARFWDEDGRMIACYDADGLECTGSASADRDSLSRLASRR